MIQFAVSVKSEVELRFLTEAENDKKRNGGMAYYRNFGKRFVKAPKIYFIDFGLCCHLLGIRNAEQVDRDPAFGGLFENMVIVDVLKAQAVCIWLGFEV